MLDDQDSPAWAALEVRAVSTMMLIDHSGHVIWRFTGPAGDQRLEEVLATLVPSESPRPPAR